MMGGEFVRYRSNWGLRLIVLVAVWSAGLSLSVAFAQNESFLGRWSGTWDGATGSGGFELVLETDSKGMLTGRVSVTGEPTYQAGLKTVSFDGNKMAARYDFPPDSSGEVVLAATFDGKTAVGTWSLREKAGGTEFAAGNWNVSKK
jgi:hypothetical protein